MNFNIATNPAERRECYDIIKIYPGVLDDMRTGRRITFEEHCRRMSSCKFVASPPGNGLDCIRTWEALYQGVIPIVKRSPLDPLFNRLPVLIVDRWTDLFFLDQTLASPIQRLNIFPILLLRLAMLKKDRLVFQLCDRINRDLTLALGSASVI